MDSADFEILRNTFLFKNYTDDEMKEAFSYLTYKIRSYDKDEIIYHTGDHVSDIGIVLDGCVQIENIDFWGNKSIISFSDTGDIFAEAYACVQGKSIMVDVKAREKCKIFFLNIPSLFESESLQHHGTKLFKNLLQATAQKNIVLSMRIFHTTPKTIRQRLYSYFSEQSNIQKSKYLTIPLNRQELADYLGVDRTNLCKELSKMKAEGLIDYKKNVFKILDNNR